MGKRSGLCIRVLLHSGIILAAALLLPALLVRFSGDLIRLFSPAVAPYFLQLHSARFTWHPLWLAAFSALAAGLVFYAEYRDRRGKLLLKLALALLLTAAAFCTVRVNGVPLRTAVSLIATLAKGGLL